MQRRRKGFTLVELSIVLVIIGLLIGGILVAQSMIATAHLLSFIRQIQQYDVAVANFETKYNSIPGDSPLFNPPGNNDGGYGYGGNVNWEGSEWSNFWVHLQQGGWSDPSGKVYTSILSNPGNNTPGLNIAGQFNAPTANYSDKIMIIPTANANGTWTFPQNDIGTAGVLYENPLFDGTKIHYLISDRSATQYFGNNYFPVFTASEALAIDIKIDDGHPLTGVVRGSLGNSCIVPTGSNGPFSTPASIPYNISDTDLTCELSILILSQIGTK